MAAPSLIGALISLYSFADIRYEGVLYGYNPTEKTVSLQNDAEPSPLASDGQAGPAAGETASVEASKRAQSGRPSPDRHPQRSNRPPPQQFDRQDRDGPRQSGRYQGGRPPYEQQRPPYQGGGRGGYSRPPPSSGFPGGSRGGGRQGGINVPKEEFDFEASNAHFDKDEMTKEFHNKLAVTESAPAAPTSTETDKDGPSTAYNKKSSFFDTISSDALDKAKGGPRCRDPEIVAETIKRWSRVGGVLGGMGGNVSTSGGRELRQHERQQNLETFGFAASRPNYRGRGRGGYHGGNRNYDGQSQRSDQREWRRRSSGGQSSSAVPSSNATNSAST